MSAPVSIRDEFDKLIADVFPNANGGCSLTYRKKKEFERIFFAGYRTCLTAVMLNSSKPEKEATETLDATFVELQKFFS